jgi:hypothetical protein
LAAAALVAGCDKTSSPTTTAPETTAISSAQSYVALGDSYTAAAGVLNQTGTPAGCLRSDANYPSLIAQRLKPGSGRLHDMSCSGATITDLTQAQSTDNGTNPAQISALSSSTTLALLRHGPDQQRHRQRHRPEPRAVPSLLHLGRRRPDRREDSDGW